MGDHEQDLVSSLVDLTEVDLSRLDEVARPVLATALESIRVELEHPDQAVSGFTSSI